MKKILSFCLILMALLSSCSKKEVKIINLKLQGDLKGCYTVVDSVCTATKNDDGKYAIQVTLQRSNESVPYTAKTIGVFGDDSENALVLGGFGYEAYKGDELIKNIDAEDSRLNPAEQLNILKLAPGEKGTLTVVFNDDVPEGIILTSVLDFVSTGEISFEGAIGRYGIKNFSIDFNFDSKKIIGQYQYKTSPAGAYLYLLGNVVSTDNLPGDYTSNVYIAEDNGHNELTGKFKGQLKLVRDSKTSPYYYVLLGTFRNFRYQDFRYEMKSAPITEIEYGNTLKNGYASTMHPSFMNEDFAQFGFRSFSDEANYTGSETGDMSVDEFLRHYRRFCKTYIKVLKKYQAGNPSVIMEYLELTNQYAELSQRADRIKGKMSVAQINELNKITSELNKALAEL